MSDLRNYSEPLAVSADLGPNYDWDTLVQEDRVHRLIYTDPAIFRAEMTKIFAANWVYLAHESQIPNENDFVASQLGLRPLIVTRDRGGEIRALFNRCTHRGARICREQRGNARSFSCAYHGWTFANSGKLVGVPWPDGYAGDFKDSKFNLVQVTRVESYRGFIFGTMSRSVPPLVDWLGPVARPIDEWIDRNPGAKIRLSEANRLKFKGNWKLAYDNSADGYHVVFSHASLLAMENRLHSEDEKGMSFYQGKPDEAPMYVAYFGNGHSFKDKRPNIDRSKPGALWRIEGAFPGMEHFAQELRGKLGAKADEALDLASSEPVNINVFPNLSILGNHIQVIDPIAVDETNTTWYGTAIIDDDNALGGTADAINAMRMRTMEGFPNFGEVDDAANFEEIQKGLQIPEDEWVYMHRGMGIPGRIKTDASGVVTGPATDELFMRGYMKEWKRLMRSEPDIAVRRDV